MATESCVPKRSIFRRSGVVTPSTRDTISPMRPISVPSPVAVTTPVTRPEARRVPEKRRDVRSPSSAFASTGSAPLVTGSDSPVRTASSARAFRADRIRRSAGTRSPLSRRTRSPGTSSSAGTVLRFPSRTTTASRERSFRIPSMAASAFPSWTKPMTAFTTTTRRMTPVSIHSSRRAVNPAATRRM
jgi:hypothetical protein